MKKQVVIIGSGFSSLAASCYLAKAGFEVTILEKNSGLGGRASKWSNDGFKFDMGPTWYWMPDIFEKFFADFDKVPKDYYQLEKLSPAYQVFFDRDDSITISDKIEEIYQVFENEEEGSSEYLKKFLESAKYNYDVAINGLVYKPGNSIFELITKETISNVSQFFKSISSDIRKNIKSHKLIQILEFPVLFLGAKPSKTPSFYNFMNHADFGLGTWHPKGGMYEVVNGCVKLAEELGVKIRTHQVVSEIVVKNSIIKGVVVNNQFEEADIVLSGADYNHTETLLDKKYRMYSQNYWEKRTFAPSALLFYVGFDKKLKNVAHHSLFFDTDFNQHAFDIYDNPKWPDKPLFYASFPSMTDDTFAPEHKEAGTFLIPLAPGIEDTPELRELYFDKIISRLEDITGNKIKDSILFKKSYCINDFISDYNSFKGNAYGLANTLTQTAFLRPKIKSKKVKNLFFTGQLTVPGPGVPPALISGKIASQLIINQFKEILSVNLKPLGSH
ncbi:phytoene desaturase family protein [Urechidicola croceus]|uniref:Phytoene dehydrogenase n=1 Tax=Urechidicola croceus TaxID=1850246 RepID=A0A1D8P3N7_9FLAO|nr:phytoene desaturase family protein [Urechidicola croceus]AOW19202.1 phytoene dehydrogenase [Urechidicola croceus]